MDAVTKPLPICDFLRRVLGCRDKRAKSQSHNRTARGEAPLVGKRFANLWSFLIFLPLLGFFCDTGVYGVTVLAVSIVSDRFATIRADNLAKTHTVAVKGRATTRSIR